MNHNPYEAPVAPWRHPGEALGLLGLLGLYLAAFAIVAVNMPED